MLVFVPLKVHFVPDMWYFLKYHEMYHICGIFLIPLDYKKLPLDVPFPENMVLLDGGERSAAVPCFSLYVNQSSCCLSAGFHWGGNIQSSEFTHNFFMGIFANEKGTGINPVPFSRGYINVKKLYNSRWTIRSMIRCFSNRRHLLFCKIYS